MANTGGLFGLGDVATGGLLTGGLSLLSGLGNWLSGRSGAETKGLKLQNKLAEQQYNQGQKSFPIQLQMMQQALQGENEASMRRRSVDPMNATILDRLQRRLTGNLPWGGQNTMNAMRGDMR